MSITVPLYGFGGAGNPLNFKVVDGTAEPSNPRENTIWVNTEKKITGYHFSVTQPKDMTEGEVWFVSGKNSSVEFNALKKNWVSVYPTYAKQFVNGSLVDVVAKTYQKGAWQDWSRALFPGGLTWTLIESEDGSYRVGEASDWSVKTDGVASPTELRAKMSLYQATAHCYFESERIDLTPFSSISVVKSDISKSGKLGVGQKFSVASTTDTALDVSDISGEHVICFGFDDNKAAGEQTYESVATEIKAV